ncbi:MAG: hypothetical protein DRQ64_04350 [Gammaproteobacteria bacterium]|nr:MAG: hypothetical protein DRQ64_04350 [Gammaproteobacteria bacterium]
MSYRKLCSIIAVISAVCFLSSCAVTTAPTEASSETTGQTTDASSDLTSSTSTNDDDGDDEKEVDVAVDEFVSSNFSQLRSDMSVGQGEYLTTLASLLAIDDASKDQFYTMTKDNFSDLFVSSKTTPQELIANLKQEVSQAKI